MSYTLELDLPENIYQLLQEHAASQQTSLDQAAITLLADSLQTTSNSSIDITSPETSESIKRRREQLLKDAKSILENIPDAQLVSLAGPLEDSEAEVMLDMINEPRS